MRICHSVENPTSIKYSVPQLRNESATCTPDIFDALLQLPPNAGDVSAVVATSPSYDHAVPQLHNESSMCTPNSTEALLQLPPSTQNSGANRRSLQCLQSVQGRPHPSAPHGPHSAGTPRESRMTCPLHVNRQPTPQSLGNLRVRSACVVCHKPTQTFQDAFPLPSNPPKTLEHHGLIFHACRFALCLRRVVRALSPCVSLRCPQCLRSCNIPVTVCLRTHNAHVQRDPLTMPPTPGFHPRC